ncbi:MULTISPECIES: M15 family metallopeptidase [unclassified Nocardioides]|uniref:M15 family metallopeptidase n=1 Tax=unclassified Nocardioides TaxID=2615069 RepID=UPI0036165C1F
MRKTALGIPVVLLAVACASPSERPAAVPRAVVPTPAALRIEPVFDRDRHSTSDPRSIWVVVNKKHPLPPGFRPVITLVRGYQVATPAAGPLAALLADSDREGLGFKIASAFRSYAYQQAIHSDAVASGGRVAADRVSARPGHSEHQTGLAVDLVTPARPGCDFDACFADTPGGRWLDRNAWRFGFVVRYQPGATAITGYSPEPWHLRYVGRALAAELRVTGTATRTATLEEFFGVTGGEYP